MAVVVGLVTVVDIADGPESIDAPIVEDPAPQGVEPGSAPLRPTTSADDLRSMALSALHLAVLRDGHRLVLLDDRG